MCRWSIFLTLTNSKKMIYIENKKRKLERIQQEYPNADILDLTSKSAYAQMLSPFYPHMNIPVPNSPGVTASCVEAVWQGLKVFENEDIDTRLFNNTTMKNIKRTQRVHGKTLGHRFGVDGKELLDYFSARMRIYLPTYKYILENQAHNLVMKIAERAKDHDIIFLDYNTNTEVRDISSPISHAGLVKLYIEGNYPDESQHLRPMTNEEIAQRKRVLKEEKKQRKVKIKDDNSIQELTLF